MYNINFDVKYKLIENELIEKIEKGENSYNKRDVYDICNEIYKNELLKVFSINSIIDDNLIVTLNDLWLILKNDKIILAMIEKEKMNNLSNIINDELLFTSLFSYDTFYKIHEYITYYFNENKNNEKNNYFIDKFNLNLEYQKI